MFYLLFNSAALGSLNYQCWFLKLIFRFFFFQATKGRPTRTSPQAKKATTPRSKKTSESDEQSEVNYIYIALRGVYPKFLHKCFQLSGIKRVRRIFASYS